MPANTGRFWAEPELSCRHDTLNFEFLFVADCASRVSIIDRFHMSGRNTNSRNSNSSGFLLKDRFDCVSLIAVSLVLVGLIIL